MGDERKQLFKINLEEILKESKESDEEEIKKDPEPVTEPDIHTDTNFFIQWLESQLNSGFLDHNATIALIHKHLSKPDLSEDQKRRLKELLAGIAVKRDVAPAHYSAKTAKKKVLIVTFLSVLAVCILLLVFLINPVSVVDNEKKEPVFHNLSISAKWELREEPIHFSFISIDPLHGLLQDGPIVTDSKPDPVVVKASDGYKDSETSKDAKNSERSVKQTLNFPMNCEVIVSTPVLSSPRIDATEVGFLEVGAIVKVIGESGSFYRISSKDGRDGYILKQDVIQITKVITPTPNDSPVSPFSPEAVDPRRP